MDKKITIEIVTAPEVEDVTEAPIINIARQGDWQDGEVTGVMLVAYKEQAERFVNDPNGCKGCKAYAINSRVLEAIAKITEEVEKERAAAPVQACGECGSTTNAIVAQCMKCGCAVCEKCTDHESKC